jgi:uncharacterized RDD family membrane protein YckC
MVCFASSLLTGVEASAAQNAPVTKTCLQCGAVLPSSVRACSFCDSTFRVEDASSEQQPYSKAAHSQSLKPEAAPVAIAFEDDRGPRWRGELEERVEAYRSRHGRPPRRAEQSRLPFRETSDEPRRGCQVDVAEASEPAEDEFSFTIAIGRYAPPSEKRDTRMLIDVSEPPETEAEGQAAASEARSRHYGLYPVASLYERQWAAFIDAVCLVFAYGGFLALFGSVGGQFTFSKLSAAVCVATFAIVYLQYFALFTVFGGTTPGMMFRGLQVASFSGEAPTPRQMLLRSLGYIVSAGTFFMGFLWAWWDDDGLTWHDRLSRTYLSSPRTRAHVDVRSA